MDRQSSYNATDSSELAQLLEKVKDDPALVNSIKQALRDRDTAELLQHFWLDAVIEEGCTIHTEYERVQGIPTQIKRRWWRKGEPLGKGAFGFVWLEQEQNIKRERAVKVIDKYSIKRDKIDYKKEILALSKFSKREYQQQEVLVKFLGWFETPLELFLYMEYFELGDLENHITADITEDDVKDITTNLLNGLRIMHDEHFTHRDLKPGNIFVVRKPPTSKWWVKIGDFGISKRVNNDQTALYTSIGTRHYMAPEVTGDLDTDNPTSIYTNAVDMWSLGCVIYKVATQDVPFQTPRDIRKYCGGKDQFPDQPLTSTLNADGVAFLKRLIVLDPEKRLSAVDALKISWLSQRRSDAALKEDTGPLTSGDYGQRVPEQHEPKARGTPKTQPTLQEAASTHTLASKQTTTFSHNPTVKQGPNVVQHPEEAWFHMTGLETKSHDPEREPLSRKIYKKKKGGRGATKTTPQGSLDVRDAATGSLPGPKSDTTMRGSNSADTIAYRPESLVQSQDKEISTQALSRPDQEPLRISNGQSKHERANSQPPPKPGFSTQSTRNLRLDEDQYWSLSRSWSTFPSRHIEISGKMANKTDVNVEHGTTQVESLAQPSLPLRPRSLPRMSPSPMLKNNGSLGRDSDQGNMFLSDPDLSTSNERVMSGMENIPAIYYPTQVKGDKIAYSLQRDHYSQISSSVEALFAHDSSTNLNRNQVLQPPKCFPNKPIFRQALGNKPYARQHTSIPSQVASDHVQNTRALATPKRPTIEFPPWLRDFQVIRAIDHVTPDGRSPEWYAIRVANNSITNEELTQLKIKLEIEPIGWVEAFLSADGAFTFMEVLTKIRSSEIFGPRPTRESLIIVCLNALLQNLNVNRIYYRRHILLWLVMSLTSPIVNNRASASDVLNSYCTHMEGGYIELLRAIGIFLSKHDRSRAISRWSDVFDLTFMRRRGSNTPVIWAAGEICIEGNNPVMALTRYGTSMLLLIETITRGAKAEEAWLSTRLLIRAYLLPQSLPTLVEKLKLYSFFDLINVAQHIDLFTLHS